MNRRGVFFFFKQKTAYEIKECDWSSDVSSDLALPCLPHSLDIAKNTWISLEDGKSAETSGGLLIALPAANAQPFIDDIMAIEGKPAWIIGKVRACVGDEKPHAVVVDSVNRFSI
eukprot:TRINITY_DN1341_c0_g1_i3.p1 TRINITY_DN1341_c0_g1~~TRINITY_DN1341_c0_g1_i3.p1  ORF type:complete len:115 (-),score=32.46 TRINITY_DN1341_c0_g1_i3:272-616(-)